MLTLILNHRVADYGFWRQCFDADMDRRISFGIKDLAAGEKEGDRGNVYIVFQVHDLAPFIEMMADPYMNQFLRDAGVVSEIEMTIVK
jgi:hypothetical protein